MVLLSRGNIRAISEPAPPLQTFTPYQWEGNGGYEAESKSRKPCQKPTQPNHSKKTYNIQREVTTEARQFFISTVLTGNQSIGQYLSVHKDSSNNPPTNRRLEEAVVVDWSKMMKFKASLLGKF
ncbi:hypothetical protein AVEN_125103-1 [Araneus ventricosus]|uniref:Uncharacterized protein n=1 Tax=Araneus ventricosus TaxID=182803 RepID=A0A4Y2M4Z8_ARAVE|nr:hypothetical protein AVEN_125103-1 [Araneus ventricosus]